MWKGTRLESRHARGECKPDEIRRRVGPKLAGDIGFVKLDGFYRNMKLPRDLLRTRSIGKSHKDLPLPLR